MNRIKQQEQQQQQKEKKRAEKRTKAKQGNEEEKKTKAIYKHKMYSDRGNIRHYHHMIKLNIYERTIK
jgi:hypothetical protein